MTRFFLGTHEVHWLALTETPLFISARRLRKRRSLPVPVCRWVLDSGGFSELSLFGRWETSKEQYVDEARRWQAMGGMEWAAIQDWMCKPFIIDKTGLTVKEQQRRTIQSYLDLTRLAPEIPWAPVLQGWAMEDYLRHADRYALAGVDLAAMPIVGLGSVCRRQATGMVEELIRILSGMGIRLHGFGFKLLGLLKAPGLVSADSMAWSFDARRSKPLPGCKHRNCANCIHWAVRWRERVLDVIDQARLGAST